MPLMEIIDVNRDGMNDLAFVDPNTQELTVLYNKFQAADTKAENLCLEARATSVFAASNPLFSGMPFQVKDSNITQLSLDSLFKKTTSGAKFNGL
jgi:hypothetical protein